MACPVNAGPLQVSKWLFKHCICFTFGCKLWLLLIQNHVRDCFQAFAHHQLKLFCSEFEQPHFSRTGHQFRSAALHSRWEFTSQHADCSYVPSSLRDHWQWNWMNDQKIALVDNKSLPIPLKFSFHMKKYSVISDLSLPKIYKALKPFWLSNLIINDSSLQQQASPCQQQLETSCVCEHLSDLFKLYQSTAQRAWLLTLQSKPFKFVCLLE